MSLGLRTMSALIVRLESTAKDGWYKLALRITGAYGGGEGTSRTLSQVVQRLLSCSRLADA